MLHEGSQYYSAGDWDWTSIHPTPLMYGNGMGMTGSWCLPAVRGPWSGPGTAWLMIAFGESTSCLAAWQLMTSATVFVITLLRTLGNTTMRQEVGHCGARQIPLHKLHPWYSTRRETEHCSSGETPALPRPG